MRPFFAVTILLHRPALESLLFSLALAVGLTPQLLPTIVGVNLARGAKQMSKEKVIVKYLASIEDLENMYVLYVDKTGALRPKGMLARNLCYFQKD